MTPRDGARIDHRGTVGRIYKEDHYTLLHTKYESSGPCGSGEDFLCFSNDAPGAGPYGPQGHVGRIYKEEHYILLHTKYEILGLVVSEKKIFVCLTHDSPSGAGPVWTPGARLAGFIKRTTIHCYTQNMKALGLVVSEKKIF